MASATRVNKSARGRYVTRGKLSLFSKKKSSRSKKKSGNGFGLVAAMKKAIPLPPAPNLPPGIRGGMTLAGIAKIR